MMFTTFSIDASLSMYTDAALTAATFKFLFGILSELMENGVLVKIKIFLLVAGIIDWQFYITSSTYHT